MIHVDFMIGTDDLEIDGLTKMANEWPYLEKVHGILKIS